MIPYITSDNGIDYITIHSENGRTYLVMNELEKN